MKNKFIYTLAIFTLISLSSFADPNSTDVTIDLNIIGLNTDSNPSGQKSGGGEDYIEDMDIIHGGGEDYIEDMDIIHGGGEDYIEDMDIIHGGGEDYIEDMDIRAMDESGNFLKIISISIVNGKLHIEVNNPSGKPVIIIIKKKNGSSVKVGYRG